MKSVDAPKPIVTIRYCRQCNWLLRSAWMAQELLSTFSEEMAELRLIPDTDGIFEITIQYEGVTKCIWSREINGGFPEIKVLKQRVRDIIDPQRDLGHIDR